MKMWLATITHDKFLYLHPPYMIKVFREVANNFQEDFCWSCCGVGGDEKDRVIKFPQLDKAADKKFEALLQ